MNGREQFAPGLARGAQARKDGENRTLIFVRELRPPPGKVWQALTGPAHLRERAPFDASGRAPAGMLKRFAGVRSLYG